MVVVSVVVAVVVVVVVMGVEGVGVMVLCNRACASRAEASKAIMSL